MSQGSQWLMVFQIDLFPEGLLPFTCLGGLDEMPPIVLGI